MKSSGEVKKRDCVIVTRTISLQVATLLVCLQVGVTIKENFTPVEKLRKRYLEEAFYLSALPDQFAPQCAPAVWATILSCW